MGHRIGTEFQRNAPDVETFDLESEVIWSAPAERSGDGALDVN
jgi:hypothetical protein